MCMDMHPSATILCLFCFLFQFHSISSISRVHLWNVHLLISLAYFVLSFDSIPFIPSQSVHLFLCMERASIRIILCLFVSYFNSIPFLPSHCMERASISHHPLLILFCLSIPFHLFHLRVSTCLCAWNVHLSESSFAYLFPTSIPFQFFHLTAWNVHLSAIILCLFCFVFQFLLSQSVHLFMFIGHASINYCPSLLQFFHSHA